MEYCKYCLIYSSLYDEQRQLSDDTNQAGTIRHFCKMFDEHIPAGIFSGASACPFFCAKE